MCVEGGEANSIAMCTCVPTCTCAWTAVDVYVYVNTSIPSVVRGEAAVGESRPHPCLGALLRRWAHAPSEPPQVAVLWVQE